MCLSFKYGTSKTIQLLQKDLFFFFWFKVHLKIISKILIIFNIFMGQ